jgi:hypothetical protein
LTIIFWALPQGSGFRQSLPDEKSGELQQMPQSLTQSTVSIKKPTNNKK